MSQHPFILTVEDVEGILGGDFQRYTKDNCHGASLAIVKSGVIPAQHKARVARGRARGVLSQHSWIVLGGDCYDEDAWIIDPTLWGNVPHEVQGVYHAQAKDWPHIPHGGASTIWAHERPPAPRGKIITLDAPVSGVAESFLDLCGPLDIDGWSNLAHAPVKGWPAADIIAAMYDTPALRTLIPIDIVGMLTDRNPSELYF